MSESQEYEVTITHHPEKTITEWRQNGLLHRLDGPALEIVYKDKITTIMEWHQSGKTHRVDGPARIRLGKGAFEEWYLFGKLHREDGPADVSGNWFIHGEQYSKEAFEARAESLKNALSPTCDGKIVEIDGKKYKLSLTS